MQRRSSINADKRAKRAEDSRDKSQAQVLRLAGVVQQLWHRIRGMEVALRRNGMAKIMQAR